MHRIFQIGSKFWYSLQHCQLVKQWTMHFKFIIENSLSTTKWSKKGDDAAVIIWVFNFASCLAIWFALVRIFSHESLAVHSALLHTHFISTHFSKLLQQKWGQESHVINVRYHPIIFQVEWHVLNCQVSLRYSANNLFNLFKVSLASWPSKREHSLHSILRLGAIAFFLNITSWVIWYNTDNQYRQELYNDAFRTGRRTREEKCKNHDISRICYFPLGG